MSEKAAEEQAKPIDEETRWRVYESIPTADWVQMSGRQPKILQQQSERYGLPLAGQAINLPDLARTLHDFLAKNRHRLRLGKPLVDSRGHLQPGENGDDHPPQLELNLDESTGQALEKLREEQLAMARLKRAEYEGNLVGKDDVIRMLGLVSSCLRKAGDDLKRRYGDDAHAIVNEALEDADREVERIFGSDADTDAQAVQADAAPQATT